MTKLKEIVEQEKNGSFDFLDFLNEENENLETLSAEMFFEDVECFFSLDESEREEIRIELGMNESDFAEVVETLNESLRRRVTSSGQVQKVVSRGMRSRRAVMTTGMSKTELKRRAIRAAKTRKRNPSIVRKALKKRRKAMRRRKQLNIRN